MHLYNLTLKRADAAIQAVAGNFSDSRQQDILISRGTALEVLRVESETGKLLCIASADTFASIRSLASFRLPGNTKDYIVVGSDLGRLVILEFSEDTGRFIKLHQETFGKSGARRIVPGQFLATDPKGRSVMVAAMEKSKLVYTLNRDAAAGLTISSPLEAHSPGTIIHHIVGVDVGFENPMFVALEVDYTESDQDPTGNVPTNAGKVLPKHDSSLDLGLSHVVRKWSEPTDPRANLLVQVPGGTGPSFWSTTKTPLCTTHQCRLAAPRPDSPPPTLSHSDCGLLIMAATMHKMKMPHSNSFGNQRLLTSTKDGFFPLLQGELGDLYKVTLDYSDDTLLVRSCAQFDTIPNLCMLRVRAGFLGLTKEIHH
ncbi:mono-functional DNA-alkylating methyl methanesulfonate N-term-domain-containing protein [Mycena vulgaris]|nr:mono-functional DNA-alkylating methyl methanesulfonate N-term-domain-containing protein [Mycena vulgaris]